MDSKMDLTFSRDILTGPLNRLVLYVDTPPVECERSGVNDPLSGSIEWRWF